MKRLPLVYLAGPYTHPDPCSNVNRVVKLADQFLADGIVTPYVPHLNIVWDLISPKAADVWYAYDLEVMLRCDAVYRYHGESTGADNEVAVADDHGIPVFTEDAVGLAFWAKRWTEAYS